MLTRTERALTASEKRLLGRRRATLRTWRASLRWRIGRAVGIVFGVLCLATLLTGEVPWWVATGLWAILGAGIGFWVFHGEARGMAARAADIERAIRYDRATVMEVRASEVVEVEEREDEGACWLFQLAGDEILVLSGQEYYETSRFPSDSFGLIDIRTEDGRVLELVIEPHGQKLKPSRRLPAEVRARLPAGDEIIKGSLRDFA